MQGARASNLRAGVFILGAFTLAACGGGGGGGLSDVGDQNDLPPVAAATVIGGGNGNTVRSGSVVLLTTKDSDGQDSPILRTTWQAADPSVVLQERTSNTVAFEAPNVAQPTDFSFTATVFDAEDQTDTVTVTLTVIPAQDLDKFLTVDGTAVGALGATSAVDFQKFTVRVNPVSVTDPVAPTDTFTVTIDAIFNYADRNASCAVMVPGSTQCLSWVNNATLQLSGLGYPFDVAAVIWNSAGGFATETLVELDIPSIDISAFNQFIINAFPATADVSARDALLDLWRADSADVTLIVTLSSPISAIASVSGPASSTIPLGLNNDVTVTAILDDASDAIAIETAQTAAAYYAAVDPGNDFLTLNNWLVARGFASVAADGSITTVQAALDGTGEFAHAIYTNNFDLGFGRNMFTRVDEATGNVYSYVVNYPTLQSAIEVRNEILTVVMEYSPPGGLANDANPGPKFTKFFVYVPDQSTGEQVRVRSIDFDGRGQKFVPGSCIACHGGTVPDKGDALAGGGYLNEGDTDAMFFPWDLESFLYSDTDPAIPATSSSSDARTLDEIDPQLSFTRTAQADQFRKLNMAALAAINQDQADEVLAPGDTSRFDAVIELLGIWYPDAIPGTLPADCNSFACLVGSFTDGAVPAGWTAEPDLYVDVFARHCRACHGMLTTTNIQFATATGFLDNPSVGDLVFRTGVMPLARLTMDRLWAGTDTTAGPIDTLRAAFADVGSEIPGGPVPVAEFAAVNPGSVAGTTGAMNDFLLTKTGRSVDVTGENSIFFDSLAWSLGLGSSDPEFSVCLQDPPALADNGLTATLAPTVAADYCVLLTAAKTDYSDVVAAPLLIRARDDQPTMIQESVCGAPFDGTTCVAVDELTNPAAPPNVPLTAQLLTNPAMPVAIDVGRLMTTLLALLDVDIIDGLDSTADFDIEFTTLPSAGSQFLINTGVFFIPTARTRFSLDELIAGDLRYQSDFDDSEITVLPTFDTLAFDVIYTGEAVDRIVESAVAQVQILPKSDSDPVLNVLNAGGAAVTMLNVAFNGAVSGSFRVDDQDVGELILDFSRTSGAPSLGALSAETDPLTIGVAGGSFTYTAGDAEAIETADSTVFNCANGGGFAAPPQDVVTWQATTGTALGAPGEASDMENLTVLVTTSFTDTGDSSPLGIAIANHVGSCSTCHDGVGLFAFPSANYANGIRSLGIINFSNPGSSTYLGSVNHSTHSGGFHVADSIERQWVFECAP